ncbi:MAG: oligosaccharide flippase family protein [Polyangiaceae bacterium]
MVKRIAGQSLGSKAVRGAAWTIVTSIGSRSLGLVGTLAITYFLMPQVLGDFSDAYIVVLSASQLSTVGVGNYVIAKPDSGRAVTWHATMFHLIFGVIAIAMVFLLRDKFGGVLHAPAMVEYVPGLAVAALLDRVSFMPERILVRDMRFRVVGLSRTLGEIAYTFGSVGFAFLGFGGISLVYGNIARAVVKAVMMCGAVKRAEWLTPSPYSKETMRDLMRFGLPFWVSATAGFASRRWDNLIISGLFGPGVLGEYNLAYNLADIPAVQVGEQIGDVLLPSFAKMDHEKQKSSLVRSTGLLALVVFPLAVGLGAVAPTVVHTLLRKEWANVGPMLTLLSALSVARPVGWTVASYLVARDQPRPLMWLGLLKVIFLLGCVATIGRLGPLWACAAVGIAFAGDAVASMWVVSRLDKIPMSNLVGSCTPPLLACVPMVATILAARFLLEQLGVHVRGVGLSVEILAGAIGYIVGALVLARKTSGDFLNLLKNTLRKKRAVVVDAA